nr:DUF58 domain-containing protein [Pararhodobacter sp. SW119]
MPPLLVGAEHLANSALPGAHGRRRAGTGAEFWQFRPAVASDSATRIDWRRSARGDEHFIRETEWQAARAVTIWVDDGAAMGFSGAPRKRVGKGDRARLLAMALALLLLRGGERVGLARADMAPRGGRAQATTLALALAETAAETGEHATPDLSATPTGGHAVLFSDFLGPLDPVEHAMHEAAERNLRGMLVQVLDPAEESLPYDGRTRFESMSGHLAFETLRAGDLRAAYRDRLAARKDRLATLARSGGWQFATLHTDSAPSAGLLWLWHALGGGWRR